MVGFWRWVLTLSKNFPFLIKRKRLCDRSKNKTLYSTLIWADLESE